MPEVLIERMTWPEIRAAIDGGHSRAIIVCASIEQHGPHLPEATDTLVGEALGIRVAVKLGDALVAPIIRPGCSQHHLGFPGTISISADLLIATVQAYIECLRGSGFRRFAVISSHGGNYPPLKEWAARGLRRDVQVVADAEGFLGAMLAGARAFGRDDATIPHADVSETAEMLALHPHLVHMDRAKRGYVGPIDLQQALRVGLRSLTPNGVLGDPNGATPAMGEAVLECVSDFIVGALSK